MKQIKQPNEKVIAFIKTNSPESEGLRRASWTVSFSEGGVNLMKNMFSGEVVQLTDLITGYCRFVNDVIQRSQKSSPFERKALI